MNGYFAVCWYELSQRRLALLTALALSVLPWVAPFFRPAIPAGEVRTVVAATVALLLGWGLAVLLGATVIASDLGAGRLSFQFAQPISTSAIWAGRLSAATVLPLLVSAVILFPVTLVEPGFRAAALGPQLGSLLLAVLLVPALVVFAHTLSVLLRARSAWLVLVLGATGIAGLLFMVSADRLRYYGAHQLLQITCVATFLTSSLGLLAASYLQMRIGRSYLQRSNQVLSIAFSCVLGAGALGFWSYTAWAVRPELADLQGVFSARALTDGWIRVRGPVRWRPTYNPTLFIRPEKGQAITIPSLVASPYYFHAGPSLLQTSDHSVVWLQAERSRDSWHSSVWWSDLNHPRPRAMISGVSLGGWPHAWSLSPSGQQLAVVLRNNITTENARLTVYEIPSGRVVVSRSIPASESLDREMVLRFAAENQIVIVARQRRDAHYSVVRRELDIEAGAFNPPVWLTDLATTSSRHIALSEDGESAANPNGLYSTRSGKQLVQLEGPLAERPGTPLRHQRLALLLHHQEMRSLSILAAGGEPLNFDFPPATSIELLDQSADGSLLIATNSQQKRGETSSSRRSFWRLDPASAEPRLLADDAFSARLSDDGTTLLIPDDGSLIEIDPLNSQPQRLVEGKLDLQWGYDPVQRGGLLRTLSSAWNAINGEPGAL